MTKYYMHDGSLVLNPSYATYKEIHQMLVGGEMAAREKMKRQGKQHAIYAVKQYRKGRLDHIDFYQPPVTLDDDEFDKRTDAAVKAWGDCVIFAVHKH